MVKKLLKYDLKNMTKILVIFYICSICLAGITRLINLGSNIQAIFILGQVFASLTYSAIGTIIVNTFVHILRNFMVNFYKDESYLTHTLPVTKNNLLLSKFLSSLIVIFSSVFVCVLSLFILFYGNTFILGLKTLFVSAISGFNISIGLFIALMFFIIFSQICAMITIAFSAIIKANTYNKKRVLKGFIWFVIYYLGSLLTTLITLVIVFAISGNITQLFATQLSQSAFITILIVALITYIIYSIFFYFLSRKMFNKGVNVD